MGVGIDQIFAVLITFLTNHDVISWISFITCLLWGDANGHRKIPLIKYQLLLACKCYWTNNRVAVDFRQYYARVNLLPCFSRPVLCNLKWPSKVAFEQHLITVTNQGVWAVALFPCQRQQLQVAGLSGNCGTDRGPRVIARPGGCSELDGPCGLPYAWLRPVHSMRH